MGVSGPLFDISDAEQIWLNKNNLANLESEAKWFKFEWFNTKV